MKGFWIGLSLGLAFVAGAFLSQSILPQAHAQKRMVQQRLTQWEYACFKNDYQGWRPEPVLSSHINKHAKQGWMLSHHEGAPLEYICFKRPRTLTQSRPAAPMPGANMPSSPGLGMPSTPPSPGSTFP